MNQAKTNNPTCSILVMLILVTVAVVLTATPALAQSTDRENPTPLTSNSISGAGVNQKTEYFYSFAATPGDVKILLVVAANKQAAVSSVDISVFDGEANSLVSAYANPDHGSSAHATRTINVKSPQTLLLQVTVSPGVSTFTISFSGSISLDSSAGSNSSAPPAATNDDSGSGETDPGSKFKDILKPPANQVIAGAGVNKKTQRIVQFSAGPGDVRFELNVKSLSNAAVSSVDIELLDRQHTEIAAGFANPSLGESSQKIIKAHFQQKQTVWLKVIISPGVDNYKLTVSGAVNGFLHEPRLSVRLDQIDRADATEVLDRARRGFAR